MIRRVLFFFALIIFTLPMAASAQYDMPSAVNLSLNASAGGSMSVAHAEYWWKVTIPSDGVLEVETISAEGMDIDLTIKDENNAQLAGNIIGSGTVERSRVANAGAGTYYIRAYRWTGEGSYTITATFTATSHVNDPETNDDAEHAIVLAADGNDTGHLGYHYAVLEGTDRDDWWVVTTSFDGALVVTTLSDSTIDVDLALYDQDGTTFLAGNSIGSGPNERTQHFSLGEGTYYIKAHCWSGYGSYTIASSFDPTGLAIDTGTNDTAESALTLPPNGEDTGHLGYYLNGATDNDDWWTVTTPSDGSLVVTTLSDSTIDVDLALYDQDGTTFLAGNSIGSGPNERTQHLSLAAGTYFIKAHKWSGYGSYSITSAYEPTSLANDAETGSEAADAINLPLNSGDTGHLGYYLNGVTDTADWWKVTTPSDGSLVVTTHSDSTLDIDLSIYDQDMTTYLSGYDINTGPEERTHHYSLEPGTYYIRAFKWTGYGSYTIDSVFEPVAYAVDPEPNDSIETATPAATGATVTGHLGYYALGATDTGDYYTFTVPAGWDSLYVHSLSDSTLDIDMHLYNSEGSTVASAGAYGPEEILKYVDVAPGAYSVRLSRWTGYGAYAFIISPTFTDPVTEGTGSITGTVAHGFDAQMIAGATVSLAPGDYVTTTGSDGAFGFMDIPAGEYTVTVSLEGFTDTAVDVNLTAGNEVAYTLTLHPSDVGVDTEAPLVFKASPPYPNPFNPATTISFTIPGERAVRIVIYDMLGQVVRVLADGHFEAGVHDVVWDGRDAYGQQVGSGVYLYHLRAGARTASGRMTLLR